MQSTHLFGVFTKERERMCTPTEREDGRERDKVRKIDVKEEVKE
jgi:hypothetical protein